MRYCDGCIDAKTCNGSCRYYREYLMVLEECLNGHPVGEEPCGTCPRKGDDHCPLYGVEAVNYKQLKLF
jgi:hypothetical protein